ncbi:sugar transporter ERD6-like 10 isoform X1 [Syzygium oleosum]|uniref:sugar transporter ERD6-like 10 isoform X1 n=1 Tax=Syzygium oleosum TaxID=219896 RepID=UPI0011D1C0E2|nr:sugar transporter ERD6-like 10 isoform X1 [Syzygium oleosum]
MERESLEEDGLSTSSLLLKEVSTRGNHGDPISSNDSSVTVLLVFSTLVAVSGSFVTGCAVGFSSPAMSGIKEDLGLSAAAYSLFGSMLTIGGLVAALLNGTITDVIGRKRTMWLSQILSTAGWLSIVFTKNAWWLDAGRALIGFGVGVTVYVVPVYIAEITPKNVRGAFASFNQVRINLDHYVFALSCQCVTFWSIFPEMQFMQACGFSLTYFVGTIVSWRTLALIGGIPGVIQIFSLYFIPESPRWLVKVGRRREFEAALQRLRGKSADISREAADITVYTETFERQSHSRFLDVFQKRYAHSLTIGLGLMLLQQFGGASAFSYYASSIFESADFSSSIGTRSVAIVVMPAFAITVILTDKAGRRPLLMVSSAGMCLSCLILGLSFYMQDLHNCKDVTPILVFLAILAYFVSLSVGMAGLPWILMSEIFPVNVRGRAGSMVSFAHWSCSWIMSYTFNFMFEWSATGTCFIFAGVCGLAILFTVKLVPETKEQALEEVQASLNHFSAVS